MSEKIRIFITALLAALCLALCVCCFVACRDEPTDETNDNVTFDTTKGELLKLQEAYDAGLLTTGDLMSAAYYYHESWFNNGREWNDDIMPESFTPMSKDPAELDDSIEEAITYAYLTYVDKIPEDGQISEFIGVRAYCGMYGDCIVVRFSGGLGTLDGELSNGQTGIYYPRVERIGNVNFYIQIGISPWVWHVTK